MPRNLSVHLLPSLASADEVSGATVVVIDILRATTTIVHALAAGAREAYPCLEIEEAREFARRLRGQVLLGGERGGRPIPGFDLGNSPTEYSASVVGGKTLVLSTTNGTRAMRLCSGAAKVVLGAFVNFSAVCRTVREAENLHLLCAGTDGQVTREDVLFAGAIVAELSREANPPWRLNDAAEIAADAWGAATLDLRLLVPLAERLRESRGGRNLLEIGQERDIEIAATVDKFDIVPVLDPATGRIYLP